MSLIVDANVWTDETVPTCDTRLEGRPVSGRQAAVEILGSIDWAMVLEEYFYGRDDDPFIEAGLIRELETIRFGAANRAGREESHLTAWVTAHMKLTGYCLTCADDDECPVPFGECWREDDGPDDGPHDFHPCWALLGDIDKFLELTAELFGSGWKP